MLMPVSTTIGSCSVINARASCNTVPRVSIRAGVPPSSNAVVSSSIQPLTIGNTEPANASETPPARRPLRFSIPSCIVASWPLKVLDWASIAP